MTVEIFTLGGYNEVGRNMTAVKVGHQVIILDMGFSMEKVAMLEDSTSVFGEHELITHDVIPDDRPIA
ncbi:TPA: ribonuclease J, partial [archaeon]|nr:ribonuclease J [Candidatus Naiadarchaeales archaeon SRR2090153.bin461]